MPPKVVFGNASVEGANRWGWFLGHFITPTDNPRSTPLLEVKWGASHFCINSIFLWGGHPARPNTRLLVSPTPQECICTFIWDAPLRCPHLYQFKGWRKPFQTFNWTDTDWLNPYHIYLSQELSTR